jgi:hypothetical protein
MGRSRKYEQILCFLPWPVTDVGIGSTATFVQHSCTHESERSQWYRRCFPRSGSMEPSTARYTVCLWKNAVRRYLLGTSAENTA